MFPEYRNRTGGLLLLLKSFNVSYGDLFCAQKRGHYLGQNAMARSRQEQAYIQNTGFLRCVQESGLAFHAHDESRKADLDARQELYQAPAGPIWSPDLLAEEAAS